MKADGLSVDIQEVEDERANGVGVLHGGGSGPTLMFNGHLDTSFTGVDDEDLPMAGELGPGLKAHAYIEDGAVWGLGAMNMKGPIATMTEAVCAISRAGIKLKGDVIVAGVAGEIEKSPVKSLFGKYQGSYYRGSGAGISYLVTHGYVADFSITTEPNGTIEYARPGFVFVKVTARGKVSYGPAKWTGQNAILRMSRVVQAIEGEFAPAYMKKHTLDLGPSWGAMKPTVNVGAIESGWPYKPGFVPGICCIYMDMRVPPGMLPAQAVRELTDFLKQREEGRDRFGGGAVRDKARHVNRIRTTNTSRYCRDSYASVAKKPHPKFSFCFADDSNVTRIHGMPSITWGPPARGSAGHAMEGAPGECIRIDDMVTTAKMYVASVIRICMQDRPKA